MARRNIAVGCCLLMGGCLLAATSGAGEELSVNFRTFQPPTGANGTLYLESAATPGHYQANIGTFFSYSYRPVVLRASDNSVAASLVKHQLTMDLVGSIGITKYGAIGLSLPTVIYQQGESHATSVSGYSRDKPPTHTFGDMALTGKVSLISYDLAGFGLGAVTRLTFPTGNRKVYVGEGAITSDLRLLAEYHLLAVTAQATVGFKVRPTHREFINTTWGNEIPWGLGATIHPQAFGWDDNARWLWAVEAYGALPAGPTAPFTSAVQSPVMIGASARYEWLRDLYLSFGLQAPLSRGVGAPAIGGVVGFQWAPRLYDMDGDGIDDRDDQCPELAEDLDRFEDFDGCPDFDNDGDGIADDKDTCPMVAEDEDDFDDDDGCPDPDNDNDKIADHDDACPDVAGKPNSNPKLHGCAETDKQNNPHDRSEHNSEPTDRDNDGIVDSEDACPDVMGRASTDRSRNGCPIADADGDTFEDYQDNCPNESETFNGVDDDDGCPDRGGKHLVLIDKNRHELTLRLQQPIVFQGDAATPSVDETSNSVIRAIAMLVNQNPDWVLGVATPPRSADGDMASVYAMSRAFAVVLQLESYITRQQAVETVGWSATPTARFKGKTTVGFVILNAATNTATQQAPVPQSHENP